MTKAQRAFCAYMIAAAAALLAYWLWSGYGGSLRVSAKVIEIQRTADEHERRAGAVVDAAKQKEEVIAREVEKIVRIVSDDALPDLLAGLLDEYRASRR